MVSLDILDFFNKEASDFWLRGFIINVVSDGERYQAVFGGIRSLFPIMITGVFNKEL